MHRVSAALAVLLLALLVPAAQAQTDQRCFPETGQCISGRIREFWERNDGALYNANGQLVSYWNDPTN